MKHHVVLAVEQEDLALGSAQLAAKSFRELYSGKSATDNDHSDWLHFCSYGRVRYISPLPPAPANPPKQRGKRHFGVLVQDRERGILRISETCKFCSKWLTEWRRV